MAAQVKDKEALQRLSFLYQAAHCVLARSPDGQELARFYCHTQRSVSRRLVLRQDPSVKRTMCKACSSLLVPGVSATVRQRRCRRQRWTIVRCLTCGLTKRFLNNPEYKLWAEQPEALLENQPQCEVHRPPPAIQGASSTEGQSFERDFGLPEPEHLGGNHRGHKAEGERRCRWKMMPAPLKQPSAEGTDFSVWSQSARTMLGRRKLQETHYE
ncbi:ribonuclease P protein subunit p21 isoform X1 [Alligator sinensis]|uniref:Ribonuclease P protein subunit p21 isoform X1 n=1 Tax=Alligator sinensis TaxID=38654 RepID=A0A3Q0HLF4_ALLSI|nr:ribonuclease P protein subunit p21 isoform X1 [Alligator sinensis]